VRRTRLTRADTLEQRRAGLGEFFDRVDELVAIGVVEGD